MSDIPWMQRMRWRWVYGGANELIAVEVTRKKRCEHTETTPIKGEVKFAKLPTVHDITVPGNRAPILEHAEELGGDMIKSYLRRASKIPICRCGEPMVVGTEITYTGPDVLTRIRLELKCERS
jgi:hypothetical protein